MKLPIYVVDAFTETLFGGNPAAVCPLEEWLPETLMQKLAAENNLAETAFVVKEGDGYRIRWFTPAVEVKLCGHATLATAHVFYSQLGYQGGELLLQSPSGVLKVTRKGEGIYTLDFPADKPVAVDSKPEGLLEGLGIETAEILKTSFDHFVVLPTEKDVAALKPDFKILGKTGGRGVIVTAPGVECDFISRFFGPQSGIDEDPVTGSAHTALMPYWAEKLGNNRLKAIQISKRRGYLDCELKGDRVLMSGHAVTYMQGMCNLPEFE